MRSKTKGQQFTRFLKPVIEVLRGIGGSGTASEVVDRVIEHLGIPEEEQEIELKSGASRVRNQVQWARLYLVHAGLVESSKRGVWSLTDQGQKVEVTGRSGDGGIDGIGVLQVNPFVSFNVLFQCKRYQGSVTPSQIRDFRGAMMGRADKGIILTTGTFTVDAKKEARRDGVPPIELVSGEDLVRLFESLELGLKPRTTYDVDEAFFEEFRR